MPHFEQVVTVLSILGVIAGVPTDVLIGGWPIISSRSGIGRRDTCLRDGGEHTFRDIDPGEPANIRFFLAFERTQAGSQSLCLNDSACINI